VQRRPARLTPACWAAAAGAIQVQAIGITVTGPNARISRQKIGLD
jgi:hypothetical protein